MRFYGIALALALGAGWLTPMAHAAGMVDYNAARARTAVTSIDNSGTYFTQLARHAGETVEIEGTVAGVISTEGGHGFLLRVPPEQTLVLTTTNADPDIAVSRVLRVLAHIPDDGTVLEALSVTSIDGITATSADDNFDYTNTIDTTVVPAPTYDTRPFTIYRAPKDLSPPEHASTPPPTDADQQPIVQKYRDRIKEYNCTLSDDTAGCIAYHILDKADRYGVDPRLVFALVAQESRFNPSAVSRSGARGLGQLMPGTAATLGVADPFDIEDNLDGSVRYLSDQMRTFGRLSLALAAYNAGPGSVKRYGGVPPFRETQRYVRTIWTNYCGLVGLDPKTGEAIASR